MNFKLNTKRTDDNAFETVRLTCNDIQILYHVIAVFHGLLSMLNNLWNTVYIIKFTVKYNPVAFFNIKIRYNTKTTIVTAIVVLDQVNNNYVHASVTVIQWSIIKIYVY